MHTIHPRAGGATLAGRIPPKEELAERAWLDEPEVPHLSARLVVSALLTAQLSLVLVSGRGARGAWVELALATVVVLWGGFPFFARAAASVRRRRPNMFALVSLGTLTAWLYGVVVVLTPSVVAPHVYLGAAAWTVTLVLVGEALERFARRRTVQAIADEDAVRRMLAPRATRTEDLADRISAALVPGVLVVAGITFVGWLAFGPTPRLPHAIASAAAVLVIASPAAIALAAPMAFLMATAAAKRQGIALRDAESTETLAKVTTLVLDRTGVLTEGRPQVTTVEAAEGVDRAELLRIVATAEEESEHPLARAVVAHARPLVADDDPSPQSVRRPIRGRGVVAWVSGRSVVLGTSALLSARGVALPERALRRAEELRGGGATVSFIAVDGRYAGLVAADDSARHDARDAIAALRRMGVRVVMMTGAARTSGRHVARELDLHEAEVFAQIHPDDRARMIARLVERGEIVAVAGAGGRHARAASAAHVGITLGGDGGAHVALADGDLDGLVRAIRLARRTTRNVHQNLALAFGYNLLAIPVAAAGCYAATGTPLSPMLAAGAMGLGTLSVIASSLRLLPRERQ